MVIDTSVIVAIFNRERDADKYIQKIIGANRPWFSTVSYLEASLVIKDNAWLDSFIAAVGIELKSFTSADLMHAVDAAVRFGKGNHRAALNLGDCAVYGTAKANKAHLLYKGNDFKFTDITSAWDGEEQQIG